MPTFLRQCVSPPILAASLAHALLLFCYLLLPDWFKNGCLFNEINKQTDINGVRRYKAAKRAPVNLLQKQVAFVFYTRQIFNLYSLTQLQTAA